MTKIRKFPKQETRVETGPIQFGDDWLGIFIRGDGAAYYAFVLKGILENEKINKLLHPIMETGQLESLYQDLKSCVIGGAKDLFK